MKTFDNKEYVYPRNIIFRKKFVVFQINLLYENFILIKLIVSNSEKEDIN